MSLEAKLYARHKPYIRQVLKLKTVGLFFEQGTGKTWITAGVIEKLLSPTFEGLVVVPLQNIETTWVKVLGYINFMTLCRTWEEFKKAPCPRVLLIHWEKLPQLDKKITRRKWTLVTLDESHKAKDRNSRQSRIVGRLNDVEYRIGCTGTPFDDFLNDPQQLWAQYRFIRPTLFGKKWGEFDSFYLYPTGWMGKKRKFRRTRLKRFLTKIEPYVIRVTLDEVLPDLPPAVVHWVPVNLLGEQARVYRELETYGIVTLKGGETVTADLKIVEDNKCHQVCGGFVYPDVVEIEEGVFSDGEVVYVGRAKIRKLHTLLPRIELPAVIFCRYLPEIDQIGEELSEETDYSLDVITGDYHSKKRRTQIIESFQAGELDVLISQVKTGGLGIDLYRSCNGIFYSTTFSYIDYDQALKRLRRDGQKRQVNIWIIYAVNTIDKIIYYRVSSKENASKYVFDYLKKIRRTGSRPLQ